MSHPDAPIGTGEEDNVELRRSGPATRFEFEPKDHVELGEALDLIDLEGGSKVAGRNWYFLRNEAVLLEFALIDFALRALLTEGFTPHITPDAARSDILDGIGFNPRGEETQIYSLTGFDLGLIATAEITLGGLLADEIIDGDRLPLKLAGVSHCFRTEAGAHGRAARGLYRVHQFSKVEMFAFTRPEQSDDMLEYLVSLEERMFLQLGIPFRVVDSCTGELGGPAYRKYDLEAWMPGRVEGGAWGEVTSASNCTDYQARRLNIRFRRAAGSRPEFVHTLNGTAIAVSRALLAILENYQQSDGSVAVPEVLRAFVGRDVIRRA
jgi:seryl-tRNA synthetase